MFVMGGIAWPGVYSCAKLHPGLIWAVIYLAVFTDILALDENFHLLWTVFQKSLTSLFFKSNPNAGKFPKLINTKNNYKSVSLPIQYWAKIWWGIIWDHPLQKN